MTRLSLLFAALIFGIALSGARADDKKKPEEVTLPTKVKDTLMAKWPKAKIDKVTKEKEGDKEVYDIEFKEEGKKFEADIFADGTIHNWEKEIATKDLPAAVTKAVESKYPKATLKTAMQVTAVKNGKDVLEGYEIEITTADKKDIELMIGPDGKILEDSSEEKKKEESKEKKK